MASLGIQYAMLSILDLGTPLTISTGPHAQIPRLIYVKQFAADRYNDDYRLPVYRMARP